MSATTIDASPRPRESSHHGMGRRRAAGELVQRLVEGASGGVPGRRSAARRARPAATTGRLGSSTTGWGGPDPIGGGSG